MNRWGAAPPCGTAATCWGGWEVSSPRGNGQTGAAGPAEEVELEQELGNSQSCGSFVQADMVIKTTPVSTNKSRLYPRD